MQDRQDRRLGRIGSPSGIAVAAGSRGVLIAGRRAVVDVVGVAESRDRKAFSAAIDDRRIRDQRNLNPQPGHAGRQREVLRDPGELPGIGCGSGDGPDQLRPARPVLEKFDFHCRAA